MSEEQDSTLPSATSNAARETPEWERADDSQLIEWCLNGEEKAWTVLIERYSRLIYTIPFRFGFTKMVADEIFQETCLILLEKMETLREKDRVRSWLVTVCRRVCIQRLKQMDELQSIENIEVDGRVLPLDNELMLLEQHHIIHEALSQLPERCQKLLKALFFEAPPPSYEEISKELAISVGSIGPTRIRCLDKLEQELLKLGHE